MVQCRHEKCENEAEYFRTASDGVFCEKHRSPSMTYVLNPSKTSNPSKNHFGLDICGRCFYSFTDGNFYYCLYDNRKGQQREIWQKCPFDDVYMQKRCIFLREIYPFVGYVSCSFYEVEINIDTRKGKVINKWEIEDINKYDRETRIQVIETMFDRKVNSLRAKYPQTSVIPAA